MEDRTERVQCEEDERELHGQEQVESPSKRSKTVMIYPKASLPELRYLTKPSTRDGPNLSKPPEGPASTE